MYNHVSIQECTLTHLHLQCTHPKSFKAGGLSELTYMICACMRAHSHTLTLSHGHTLTLSHAHILTIPYVSTSCWQIYNMLTLLGLLPRRSQGLPPVISTLW